LSDQTEEPIGALPKGYEPNAQDEPQDQDKKIWDKYYTGEIELPDVIKALKHYRSSEDTELETSDEDQREKDLKEYERKYLSRYKQPKSGVKKSTSWTQHDVALGRLTLSQHFNAKRRAKQNEIREYEKQYLSRYKQPKSGVKKSSDLKHNTDLGTLTLRQYVNAKRKAKQDEIKEYEKQYLSRYKEPKPKKRAIQLEWEPEPKPKPKPKRDIGKNEKTTRMNFLHAI